MQRAFVVVVVGCAAIRVLGATTLNWVPSGEFSARVLRCSWLPGQRQWRQTRAFPSASPLAPEPGEPETPCWLDPGSPIIARICVTTKTMRNPGARRTLLFWCGSPPAPSARKRGREHRSAPSLAFQGGYAARAIAISHSAAFSRRSEEIAVILRVRIRRLVAERRSRPPRRSRPWITL